MHELRLHYFDFHGGRGEVARLAMALGKISFEDVRIPLSDWPSLRESIRFQALPVLEIDGETVSQSNTINRFIGRLANLYPDDSVAAARCDEVMDAVEDILTKVVVTFGMQDEAEKKAAREELADGEISLYLRRLQEILTARGGNYFADDRLTVADLKVFIWIRSLRSGILDYIPADLVDRVAPRLVEHFDRVSAEPGIVAYYAAH